MIAIYDHHLITNWKLIKYYAFYVLNKTHFGSCCHFFVFFMTADLKLSALSPKLLKDKDDTASKGVWVVSLLVVAFQLLVEKFNGRKMQSIHCKGIK